MSGAAAAPRILIVRTSALGDVVHSLPVLTALRRHLPRARIGWVIEAAFAPVLAGHPLLDRLIVAGLRPWRRRPASPATWRQAARFVGELVEFAPDIVLDLMGNHKAGAIAALTLSDRRIGLARRERREPSSAIWLTERVASRGPHAVERALSLVDALGLPRERPDFGGELLCRGDGAPAEAGGGGVVIHAGAGWANKRYPPEAWGEAGARIAEASGLPVRVTVGPGEGHLARRVVAAAAGRVGVEEAEGLPALAAVLRRARLVLGGDTGPLHLARALGTPVLCLMGPTDPAASGPWGGEALWHRLPCSFCQRRLDSTKACLLEIPPARVARRALEVLAVAKGTGPAPGVC